MALQAIGGGRAPDEFSRLHRLFVQHFTMAVGFAWLASAVAAIHAPWVRNIRGLIDPAGRVESTFSFLFGVPVLMTAALLCAAFGADVLRRSAVVKNQQVEFAVAGAAVLAVFVLAIHRAVTACLLGL